ncbi:MAG: GH116 family glycosyl hydrolase [Lachnospiraceae bacterium]
MGCRRHGTSFYLAALQAFSLMCDALGEDASAYRELYRLGRSYMEERLFNGEYFIQELNYRPEDLDYAGGFGMEGGLTPEVKELLAKEGPRYQYGKGCLSDGVLGFWLGEMSGLSHLIDEDMLKTSLKNIFDNNFRADLSTHANPQRAGYAVKHDGGLLLCTWPHGGRPMLPFVYCDEVWTGIEYQVAAHLILKGYVTEGRTILRAIRSRYDGRVRNPFDEYECGHWYARSMAAYGLCRPTQACGTMPSKKPFTSVPAETPAVFFQRNTASARSRYRVRKSTFMCCMVRSTSSRSFSNNREGPAAAGPFAYQKTEVQTALLPLHLRDSFSLFRVISVGAERCSWARTGNHGLL